MLTQLPLDFSTRLPPPSRPIIAYPTWMDVSDITTDVGFSGPVSISLAFSDALEATQLEVVNEYDQRLYDALRLAHFELSLNDGRPASFTFTFTRAHWKTGELFETSLRLCVEKGSKGIRLGLKDGHRGCRGFIIFLSRTSNPAKALWWSNTKTCLPPGQ